MVSTCRWNAMMMLRLHKSCISCKCYNWNPCSSSYSLIILNTCLIPTCYKPYLTNCTILCSTCQVYYKDITAKNLINIPIKDRSEEHTSELQSRFDLVCR